MTPAFRIALELHQPKLTRQSQWDVPDPAALRANRIRASLTLDSWPHKIAAFRSLFCLDQHNNDRPGPIRPERTALHRMLLQEEFAEVMNAIDLDADIAFYETIDGLLDLIYVALGWLSELGLPPDLINQLMDEVHASNLTKADSDGKPIFRADGKVLKSEHYQPVDLRAVIASYVAGLTTPADDATVDVPQTKEQPNG